MGLAGLLGNNDGFYFYFWLGFLGNNGGLGGWCVMG